MPSSPSPAASRPPTVLRASSLEDLACLVPHLLGFVPRASLVAGYLSGPRRQLGLTARFDLPDDNDSHGRRTVTQRVVELAAQVKAEAAFLLVYGDSSPGERAGSAALPGARLTADLEQRLRRSRVTVIGPGLVTGGRLWAYDGSGPGSLLPSEPAGGAALALAAEDALAGRRLLQSREELAATVQAHDRVTDDVFAHALERARVEVAALAASAGWPAVAVRTQQHVLAAAAAAAGDAPFDVESAADVLAALEDARVRDAVLTLALDALAHDIDDEPVSSAEPGSNTRAGGRSTALPDEALFPSTSVDPAALLAACIDLAGWSRGDTTAAGCAVLAGIAYALHHGPLAGVALERALEADPAYPLARLLMAGMDAALHPRTLRASLREVRDELALPVPGTGAAA